jgi:hypothetical protein
MRTSIGAWGKLELHYSAYSIEHVLRLWVREFAADSGVGTFSGSVTPLNLDSLASDVAALFKPIYHSGSVLTFGNWIGYKNTGGTSEGAVPIVDGAITPGSSSYDTPINPGLGASQSTFNFRDSTGKLARWTVLGGTYYGPNHFLYSGVGSNFKAISDYITGSAVIVSRGGHAITSLIDITFDTNDGTTKRIRR